MADTSLLGLVFHDMSYRFRLQSVSQWRAVEIDVF
jgi:hypothetical protein